MEQEKYKNKYTFMNIGANICNTIRATLGPKGMNKLVLNKDNSKPILTNDGATIIKNLAIDHPIGKMIQELAESQEVAIGDGTTTAVLLAGQLLENATSLLNKKIHPTTILKGYDLARLKSLEFIEETQETADIEHIIRTTFGAKIPKEIAVSLTHLIITALKKTPDTKKIRLAKRINADPMESFLVSGYVFDGVVLNDRMPKEINGNIVVLDMHTEDLEFAKFDITSTQELGNIEEYLKEKRRSFVNKLKEKNIKAVFLTKTNPQLEHFLTEAGIMEVVTYKREYIDNICNATGANVLTDLKEEILEKNIGKGRVVYERDIGITIEGANSDIITLVLCGETPQVADEILRSVEDVLGAVRTGGKAVVGAGAFEIALSLYLRKYAFEVGGKEQLAIEEFANAIESIPLVIAENCGFDAIDIITSLKSQHQAGNNDYGVDDVKGISNARERNIFEPALLKKHAINSATDVANLILKLDDIYVGASKKED